MLTWTTNVWDIGAELGHNWDLLQNDQRIGYVYITESVDDGHIRPVWFARYERTQTWCEVSSLQTAAGWLLAQAGAEVGK